MKIGILGGTFNPPHNGHISVALKFKKHLSLDKVLFIPTYIPPHKDSSDIDAQTRLEMTRLAVKGIDGFEVSDVDIVRGGKSYAVLTVSDLKTIYPDGEFYFLCGSDMFLTLESWYKSDELFNICSVAGAARDNGEYRRLFEYAKMLKAVYNADARVIRIKPFVISSSVVRNKIAMGEDVSQFINNDVLSYIKDNGLYKE